MDIVNVKLRTRNKNKYRKLVSTSENIYDDINAIINTSVQYNVETLLDDGEWFYIENITNHEYSIDILTLDFQTVDFDSLNRNDFEMIDYLLVSSNKNIYFQKVSKSRLVSKKAIYCLGQNYEFKSSQQEIVINDVPDAIYVSSENRLYFRKLETIASIFKGIDQLYREATNGEVEEFLNNDFISLQDDYCASSVKTANRKRIALAKKTLESLNQQDKNKIFDYIGEYCPELKTADNSFEVGNEEEMKMLLYGIEQRFYTTPVGDEKRIANSIIKIANE